MMISVLASVISPSLSLVSASSSSPFLSSRLTPAPRTTISWDAGASTKSQVQSMTSLAQSTTIKSIPTSQSFKATMPNDTEPTVTTESSSKTPIKLPTTSTSSSARPTSHSTTSVSSRHETSTNTSHRPQTSEKFQSASPIAPSRTTTSVSLEGNTSPRSTRTSTITDQPESTFSKVVGVTLTTNGTIAISTPAMVTVFSMSTLPDGDFVTYTHVIANPTGFGARENQTGFLGNHGAVAGVFVVVGIIISIIGLCFVFLFRRRLRRNRRRRWLEGMHQQDTPSSRNPFEDPDDTPHMRTFVDGPVLMDWGDREPETSPGIRNSLHSSSSQRHSGVGLVVRSATDRTHPGEVWNNAQQHGLTLPLDHSIFHSGASIAQSSPSIYPATLPPDADDRDNDVVLQQPETENIVSPPSHNPFVVEPPPRPPRSILRRNSMRAPAEMYPLTPPASISSHSHSNPPSPIVDLSQSKGPHDILNRRTLLDLRPRTSPDSITSAI